MARPRRVERFKITMFRNRSGTKSWRVSGTKSNGERIRENFGEQGVAFDRKAELDAESAGVKTERSLQKTSLTSDQIADAETAFQSGRIQSISRIVSHYLLLEQQANETGVSLDRALNFTRSHYRPKITEMSILSARDKFLSTRTNLAEKSLRHYELSTGLLLGVGPNKPLHKISVLDLENLLKDYKNPNSLRSYRTGISVFFNWAVRHHIALENPCERLDKIPQDQTQIAILSLVEVKWLLKAAMHYADGAMVPSLALALFAGLRPSEIEELNPSQISTGRISVTGGKMRRKINRVVSIPSNLAAWLQRYPFKGTPKGADGKHKAIKKAAGAVKWKQDILQHTSISHQVERDQNIGSTALNCGTSVAMIEKHYRQVIEDPKESTEFWSLTPCSIGEEKIMVILPASKRVFWPKDKHLAKMLETMPATEIGRRLDVSDVAVRKRCLKRNIPIPATRFQTLAAEDRY